MCIYLILVGLGFALPELSETINNIVASTIGIVIAVTLGIWTDKQENTMSHIMQQHYIMRTKFQSLSSRIDASQVSEEMEQVIETYKRVFHCTGAQAYQSLTRGMK